MSKSPFEDTVRQKYESLGFRVLDSGWPDFLLWKPSDYRGGEPLLHAVVEVKSWGDGLRSNQKTVLRMLANAGINTVVAYEEDFVGSRRTGFGEGRKFREILPDVYEENKTQIWLNKTRQRLLYLEKHHISHHRKEFDGSGVS